jgi:RES domain-containing protein
VLSKESPEVQELFDRILACLPLAVKLKATGFRSAGVKYANETDLISGDGAGYYGGRWNPPGIRAVYMSLDPVTATKESYQELAKFGFKDSIKPRVMAGAKLKLRRLLDLTDAKVRRKLRFRLDELTREDWHAIQSGGVESWTQAIGRGCRLAGFEGVIAPSARYRGGKTVVAFPDNLGKGSSIELMLKEELPPHPSDWPKKDA